MVVYLKPARDDSDGLRERIAGPPEERDDHISDVDRDVLLE